MDARITIKKIPQSILKACQFGKKEYLLPIKERAMEEVDEDEDDSYENLIMKKEQSTTIHNEYNESANSTRKEFGVFC